MSNLHLNGQMLTSTSICHRLFIRPNHIRQCLCFVSQRITYAKKPSNATLARTDPSASREAAAIQAAKLTVSRAQGEYEALEKEREEEESKVDGGAGKRELDDGQGGPAAKRVKNDVDGDDEEMEIEMEDDEDGKLVNER